MSFRLYIQAKSQVYILLVKLHIAVSTMNIVALKLKLCDRWFLYCIITADNHNYHDVNREMEVDLMGYRLLVVSCKMGYLFLAKVLTNFNVQLLLANKTFHNITCMVAHT